MYVFLQVMAISAIAGRAKVAQLPGSGGTNNRDAQGHIVQSQQDPAHHIAVADTLRSANSLVVMLQGVDNANANTADVDGPQVRSERRWLLRKALPHYPPPAVLKGTTYKTLVPANQRALPWSGDRALTGLSPLSACLENDHI
jgi:hypothetical protein